MAIQTERELRQSEAARQNAVNVLSRAFTTHNVFDGAATLRLPGAVASLPREVGEFAVREGWARRQPFSSCEGPGFSYSPRPAPRFLWNYVLTPAGYREIPTWQED